MKKNIVLCADGTGNRGGYTPDSNVYKVYSALEIHNKNAPQIKFYDNGVGTALNKYWRGLTGAFGVGFKRNVCDLYEFLACNYNPGDDVYLFGFSRGAATVRAFSGFIAGCGLIDGRTMERADLADRIEKVFKKYQSGEADLAGTGHGVVPIRFIGVWDTVAALGFPRNWDLTGLGMSILKVIVKTLDRIADFLFPHEFYNMELTANVENACQALAIDDERKSFSPLLWDETGNTDTHIEQVWFAGAHSNVGGGYGRAGLANVTFNWMIVRAQKLGLVLKEAAVEKTKSEENAHGRLYNSRDRFGIYYRYHPREIEALSQDKIKGKIKIHRSVLDRMANKTANYAPGHLPHSFEMVETPLDAPVSVLSSENQEQWEASHKKIDRWVLCRKWLYALFLEFTLLFVISAGIFWNMGVTRVDVTAPAWTLAWIMGNIAGFFYSILPAFFEGLITVTLINHPIFFALAVVFLSTLWGVRRIAQKKIIMNCEESRKMLMANSKSLVSNC